MTDVAIVVGHHTEAKGGTLRLGEHTIQEYDLWGPFAASLCRHLEAAGIEAERIFRPNPKPDQALADAVNATGAACAIELHFNGAQTPRASGTEMLYWPASTGGEVLARWLQEHTVSSLRLPDRGIKAIDTRNRWPFLRYTKMPAVICEPAFGTNPEDAWRLLTRQTLLVEAYALAIAQYLSKTSLAARKAA